MKKNYKILVEKLFLAYLNKTYLEYDLNFEEYQYLLYHKLDMVFFSVCKNIKHIDPQLLNLFQIRKAKIEKVNKLYQNEIDRLLQVFNSLGVKYAILKGWACVIELYYNKIDRYFGDIDIFVEEKKLSDVEKILFDNGYQYGIEKEGRILQANREKILFQRYYTHEIYNMIKQYQEDFINIDINFRFSWKGRSTSLIGNIKLSDIDKYIVSYSYENKKYNILDKELFFIHLCCHFANEAWFFLLDTEYTGGDPKEISLFRLLDICLLLQYIDIKKVREIAIKMDCVKHIEFVGEIIKIVMGKNYFSQFWGEIIENDRLNKYMTVSGEWREWPISIEERIFVPRIRKNMDKLING